MSPRDWPLLPFVPVAWAIWMGLCLCDYLHAGLAPKRPWT